MEKIKEYINQSLADIPESKELSDFKKKLNEDIAVRDAQLRNTEGIDETSVEDTIIGEHQNIKQEFNDFCDGIKAKKKNKRKKRRKTKLGISLIYLLLVIAGYLGYSFFTLHWSTSWIIIEIGLTLLIVGLLLSKAVAALANKEKSPVLPRFMVATSIMIASVSAFLVLQLVMKIKLSFLIFIGAILVVLVVDAIIAKAKKRKYGMVNVMVYLPVFAALIYVILALVGMVEWHPGWLIPVVGVIFDLILLIAKLLIFPSKKEEKEPETPVTVPVQIPESNETPEEKTE